MAGTDAAKASICPTEDAEGTADCAGRAECASGTPDCAGRASRESMARADDSAVVRTAGGCADTGAAAPASAAAPAAGRFNPAPLGLRSRDLIG